MSDINVNTTGPMADPTQFQPEQNSATELKKGNHVVGTPAALGTGATAPVGGPTDAVDSQLKLKATAPGVVNTDAPHLPNPTGESASPETVMRVVADPLAAMGCGLFAAFQAMTKARQNDITLGVKIKVQQGANQVQAAKDELTHKEHEIDGQRLSAVSNLIFAVAGTAASGVLAARGAGSELAQDSKLAGKTAENGSVNVVRAARDTSNGVGAAKPGSVAGPDAAKKEAEFKEGIQAGEAGKQNALGNSGQTTQEKQKADDMAAKANQEEGVAAAKGTVNGSVMRAASMSISGTITSFGTVFDKLIGGQRAADDAAIDQKGDLIKKQVAQNNADAANSFLDDAKEKRKNAQSALIAHVQLAAEAGSKASQL